MEDLEPTFQSNVIKFINMLKEGGAKVTVTSTRRNEIRAYLMHYSWRIANEELDPQAVPLKKGVDISWNHGSIEVSRKGAKEMVNLFGIAFRPSLTSNHIKGLAIDMNITWIGNLSIGPLPGLGYMEIQGPKDGAKNRELHEVGLRLGVRKLLKDPPHWSSNGR